MLRSFKRLVVTSAVVAAVTALIPVTSGAAVAVGPCQARDVVKLHDWSHTVAVTGQYTSPGAIDVKLTCGIVQNGSTVTRISESAQGPVAAIATTTNVAGQYYSVCYELDVTYIDHTTHADTCP
jgi:hypothetical protein